MARQQAPASGGLVEVFAGALIMLGFVLMAVLR